jgi:hypothetical protein
MWPRGADDQRPGQVAAAVVTGRHRFLRPRWPNTSGPGRPRRTLQWGRRRVVGAIPRAAEHRLGGARRCAAPRLWIAGRWRGRVGRTHAVGRGAVRVGARGGAAPVVVGGGAAGVVGPGRVQRPAASGAGRAGRGQTRAGQSSSAARRPPPASRPNSVHINVLTSSIASRTCRRSPSRNARRTPRSTRSRRTYSPVALAAAWPFPVLADGHRGLGGPGLLGGRARTGPLGR